jgi:BMFP domain-containing protein YqiC
MTRRLITLKQRIRQSLAEMDYAQRRSFEIRTGVPATRRVDSARDKALIAELEAHFRV